MVRLLRLRRDERLLKITKGTRCSMPRCSGWTGCFTA